MIKNFRHSAIVVSDMKKCLNFYQDFFEFQKISDEIEAGPFIEKLVGIPGAKIHVVKLKSPNSVVLELLQYLNPNGELKKIAPVSNNLGHSHIAFTVDNIEDFIKTIESKHGKVLSAPQINLHSTVKVCYVRDPEQNILEIVEEL